MHDGNDPTKIVVDGEMIEGQEHQEKGPHFVHVKLVVVEHYCVVGLEIVQNEKGTHRSLAGLDSEQQQDSARYTEQEHCVHQERTLGCIFEDAVVIVTHVLARDAVGHQAFARIEQRPHLNGHQKDAVEIETRVTEPNDPRKKTSLGTGPGMEKGVDGLWQFRKDLLPVVLSEDVVVWV